MRSFGFEKAKQRVVVDYMQLVDGERILDKEERLSLASAEGGIHPDWWLLFHVVDFYNSNTTVLMV